MKSMKTWKVFILCHNTILDDMYEKDPDFSAEHFEFLKLGRHDLRYNPAKGYRVSSELDYPVHLDAPNYAELTGMYCVYKNRLHDGLDYVGFSHYDKEHRLIGSGGAVNISALEAVRLLAEVKRRRVDGPMDITERIRRLVDVPSPVHVSLESHDFRKIYGQRVLMDDRQPDAFVGEGVNCIDRILEEYNGFFGTRFTLEDVARDGFLTMCDCFVTPVDRFEKLMSFLTPVIESRKLDIYDTGRRHRLQGGLLERYVAVFFALEKIEKVDMTIVHRNWEKRPAGGKMNFRIEKAINGTFLYDYVTDRRHRKELLQWLDDGRPCPPPHLFKQSVVKEYARRFSLATLVETGTYLGFMVDATKGTFRRIYSIELDEALHRRAARKFSRYNHVSILQGDSGEVLAKLLESIREPCLFWLDAHHSSGAAFKTAKGKVITPIVAELERILSHPKAAEHVILIDDAREFAGANDYPTIDELRKFVGDRMPGFRLEVRDDIVRIHKA
jgi:hypothetical protein